VRWRFFGGLIFRNLDPYAQAIADDFDGAFFCRVAVYLRVALIETHAQLCKRLRIQAAIIETLKRRAQLIALTGIAKIEFAGVPGLRSMAPSLTWIHDVQGNAPITLGTLREGTKSYIAAVDAGIDKSLSTRVSYRAWLGRGNDADRFTDRNFVAFSLTRTFH